MSGAPTTPGVFSFSSFLSFFYLKKQKRSSAKGLSSFQMRKNRLAPSFRGEHALNERVAVPGKHTQQIPLRPIEELQREQEGTAVL